MPFLANLKIKYKLALMLFFPLLGLLYFSITLMIEKAQTAQDMAGLAELTQLTITLSHIVHAVQLERGASSLFLKNQGQKFSKELSEYRAQTDSAITALKGFVQQFDTHGYEADFLTRLAHIRKALTGFKSIREAVGSLNIQQPEAVKRYTEINNFLFQFVIQSTHLKNYKDVFPLKLAYINLLKAKEKAGLERALLSAVFSQDAVQPIQFRQFAELVAVEEAYLNHDLMNYLTAEQKRFLNDKLLSGQFIEETTRLRDIVYAADAANGVLQKKVVPEYWFSMQTGKINLLKEVGDKIAHDLKLKADETSQAAYTDFINLLGMMIIIIGLAITFFVMVLRGTTRGLEQAVGIANAISENNLENQIEINLKDETGLLLQAFARMQNQLRERIEKDKRIADEAVRINRALDSATTNILMTDAEYNIIYLNETAQRLFQTEEDKIRQALPDFDASRLLGANFDLFHKKPAYQHLVLDKLTSSRRLRITIGELSLDHIITPVINDRGKRLGMVIEFSNRTAEVATEQEINQVIQAASQGDFQQRIQLEDKSGFFKTFSESVNQIMAFNQRAIEDILHIISALADGDLTQQIENNYLGAFEQLKNDMNTTVHKLTEIMTAISQTAGTVNRAASEISQGNTHLSQRTEEQAASLEETATSMEQMTSSVRQNADNARQAAQLATTAKNSAEKGGEVVGAAIVAMTEISKSSHKITDIISVIDEIAFQTNLLALNAAVEAARAGEQGRGFAVVASEVRNLAQRSAAAAKEIKGLIKDSVAKVEEGTKLANKSGETLQEIVLAVKKVSDIIAEIAAASQEQSSGIQQVNKTIAQMDEMTQQNAVLVQETATASSAMKEQAQSLKEQVAFFKIAEDMLFEDEKIVHQPIPNQLNQINAVHSIEPFKRLALPLDQDSEWKEF